MSEKKKWPRAEAEAVARELVQALEPSCEQIVIAGSIRRRKELVGDIELVYIPKFKADFDRTHLFHVPIKRNLADEAIKDLFCRCTIEKRLNVRGSFTWGENNKLAVHNPTGISVDFFATRANAWWNYLVCRTGGAVSNTRIATEAQQSGWKWQPTREGFERASGPDQGRVVPMHSEREVFEFVKLPYLEPEERS